MTVPDTLPAGSIPPNPVELLADRRLADAIAVLRNEYDVIIIDCPPVEIVTDARVINDHVDRTLFVVRAGLFDKAMLPDLDALYRDGEYRGLCCVLNGTASSDGYYGNYGTYGHYGYYGHNGPKNISYAKSERVEDRRGRYWLRRPLHIHPAVPAPQGDCR